MGDLNDIIITLSDGYNIKIVEKKLEALKCVVNISFDFGVIVCSTNITDLNIIRDIEGVISVEYDNTNNICE
jgi:hypothetical protein